MGLVYAEVELINAGDLCLVRNNYLDVEDVKRISVRMLVDTGVYNL